MTVLLQKRHVEALLGPHPQPRDRCSHDPTSKSLVSTRPHGKDTPALPERTFAPTFLAHGVQDSFKRDLLTRVVSEGAFFPLVLTANRRTVPFLTHSQL